MRFWIFLSTLAFLVLACKTGSPERKLNLYPSPTVVATQTERVVQITTTPPLTYTSIVQIVTQTPSPVEQLCVDALVAVHLRPSPNESGYPVLVLANGTVVEDLGGRDGKWMFVRYNEAQGWVFGDFLSACNNIK